MVRKLFAKVCNQISRQSAVVGLGAYEHIERRLPGCRPSINTIAASIQVI